MSAVWKNQIQSLLFHTVGWIYWLYQCSFVACVCKKLCWWHGSRRLTLCKELPARTTAAEVICCLDTHFASKSIDWKNRASVCTDVAASMTGIQHGVAKQFLKRARQAKWTHYFLHRENLAARQMLPEVHEIMSVAVKTELYEEKCTAFEMFRWHVRQAQFRSLAAPVSLWG